MEIRSQIGKGRAAERGRRQDTVGRRSSRPGRRHHASAAQTIGNFIRATRESQSLSQERLAELTNGKPGRVSRAMISAVERGLHLPGLEVLLTLSQVLHISPNEVLERLELSRTESVDAEGLTREEMGHLAVECFWAGDYRRAAGWYDAMLRALAGPPPADPAEEKLQIAKIEIPRGAALRRCGATNAARAAVERAISLTDDEPEFQCRAYVVLAALLIQLGCLPLARDAADRAVQLSESASLRTQGWAWIEKGEALAASGKFADARLAFLEAGRRVRRAGDRNHEINVEGNIGWCLECVGDRRRARARYRKAIELARSYKVPASEALWLVSLGRLSFLEHDTEQADDCAVAALAIAKPREIPLTTFRAEWLRHLVHRSTRPADSDRHRVAFLKKLYARLDQHRGVDEINEFERTYCPAR